MNTKVRLSNIDRGIEIFTAVNSYKSRKINEQILVQQINNNKHLSDLKRQMSEANSINRQILANQLKAEEQKEEQKYYKALSFHLNEMVDIISKNDDQMILNYVVKNYYNKIKSNIIEANDKLDEISDKTYNKQVLDKINEIKNKSLNSIEQFNNNILSKVDEYAVDFKSEESRISNIRKSEFVADKVNDKWKINPLRILGIVVFGVICLFFIFGLFVTLGNGGGDFIAFPLICLLVFGTPLFFLIKSEVKWRKQFSNYKQQQNAKRLEIESKKIKLESQFLTDLEKEKETLLNHPFYNAMIEINNNHPTFDKSLSEITELEIMFEKKWGI